MFHHSCTFASMRGVLEINNQIRTSAFVKIMIIELQPYFLVLINKVSNYQSNQKKFLTVHRESAQLLVQCNKRLM
jgi:translation elongation factor EF-1alpha